MAGDICPWCGNQMQPGHMRWFVPADSEYDEAILCSERCLLKWCGADD